MARACAETWLFAVTKTLAIVITKTEAVIAALPRSSLLVATASNSARVCSSERLRILSFVSSTSGFGRVTVPSVWRLMKARNRSSHSLGRG